MMSSTDSPLVGGGFERFRHNRARCGGSSLPAAFFVVVLLLTSCVYHEAAWTPPKNYEDATFTGTSSVLSGNTDLSLSGVSAFTLRFKVALDLDFSDYGRLLDLRPLGATNTDTSMQFHQKGSAYGDNANKIGFYLQKGSVNNRCGQVSTTNAWTDPNTVLDIVLSFDGTRSRIYVNGELEGTSTATDSTCTTPTFGQFQMGGSTNNMHIKGTVSFFTVWSGTALSSSQVSEMYPATSLTYPNVPPPTHHYALNEGGTSTTAYDWMGTDTLSFTGSWTNRLEQPCSCMRDKGFIFKGSA